jgi:hypothetical protein
MNRAERRAEKARARKQRKRGNVLRLDPTSRVPIECQVIRAIQQSTGDSMDISDDLDDDTLQRAARVELAELGRRLRAQGYDVRV